MRRCIYRLGTLSVFLLLFMVPCRAQSPANAPIFDMRAPFHPVVSRAGMVVSQEQLASDIGADILLQGGNAVDAAVATGFALAVTLPQAGNIGGGGFMLIYLASEDRTIALDYREMAPAAAYGQLFQNPDGEVDARKARFSLQASGVPGTVAGLTHALEKYGSMSLKQVLKPAIKLAEKGIRVNDTLVQSLSWRGDQLREDAVSAAYFFQKDGAALQPGQIWRQQDLGWSLRQIASQGAQAFYSGAIADKIVATMVRGGGLISKQDLAAYRVVERQPLLGSYRGYEVASMPPPSSGGVHLLQMLNMLENWQLGSMEHNSAAYIHRLAETMRRAYADRSEYLGDPDFTPVPVAALTDKDYATRLLETIDLTRASESGSIRPGRLLSYESPQTTHFSTWDKQGNVVSNTYTLNFSFGSGKSVAGAGFLLNNEMDDFSAKPGVANAYGLIGSAANGIEPGKRPLSSMTPSILFKDGKPVLATGSPGGSTIITVVLQLILNVIDFDMNIAEATAAARVHHQWWPDMLLLEPGISADSRRLLGAMGHDVSAPPRLLGKLQSIARRDAILFGSSDYRWPGSSVSIAE